MNKEEVKAHLESKGIKVLRIVNYNGKPKATISWRDYPRIRCGPVRDARLYHDFDITLR